MKMFGNSELEYLWQEYRRQNERIKELEDEVLELGKMNLKTIEVLRYYIDGGLICAEKNCKKRKRKE